MLTSLKNNPQLQKIRENFFSWVSFALKYYAPWAWLGSLLLIFTIFAFLNSRIMISIDPNLRFYFIYPVLYLLAALSSWLGWKNLKDEEKPALAKPLVIKIALAAGFVYVSLLIISGLIWGFGNSPYTHKFPYVLGNLFFLLASLLAIETTRSLVLYKIPKKFTGLAFALAILLFSFLEFSLNSFTTVTNVETGFIFFGKRVLPVIGENLLITYLAWIGGPLAAIFSKGILELFYWLSPILPKVPWLVNAFVGTLIPVFVMLGVSMVVTPQSETQTLEKDDAKKQPDDKNKKGIYTWLVVGLLSVAVIWFNTGLLGVRPFLVSGISMNPAYYTGDIVVIKDVHINEIEVGDVVLFATAKNNLVLHRVIEIEDDHGKTVLICQGDNVNVVDDPVTSANFRGKAVFSIPKIGWVSIGIRKAFAWIF